MKGICWLLLGFGMVVLPACVPIDFFVPWSIKKHYNTVAPPSSVTTLRIHYVHKRILRYWERHGTLPSGFDELPPDENGNQKVVDAWEHPLLWESDGVRYVTVSSLGEDGVSGGDGVNDTISQTFDTMKAINGEYYIPLEWERASEQSQ